MANDPTLLIGDMPGISTVFDITLRPGDYLRLKHRRRYWGGHWDLTFFLSDADIGVGASDEYFNTWLMNQIAEYHDGALTWRGVIWEMNRVKDGKRQQRSVTDVRNAIKCVYTETGSTTQGETAWQTNDDSISRYLRRELLVYKDNISSSQAVDEANEKLMLTYDAWAESTDFNTWGDDGLEITAFGMGRLFNNTYCTVTTPAGLVEVATFIDDIWDTDLAPQLPFLSLGGIDANALQVEREQRAPVRCGRLIDALARGGDSTIPYRWYIGPDLQFRFEAFSNTPTLEWRGRSRGGIFRKGGAKVSWAAEPGVLDDVTSPAIPALPGDFLQLRNHELIQQFSMWQGGVPKPELEDMTEAQLLADIEAYRNMMTDGNFDRLHTPGAAP